MKHIQDMTPEELQELKKLPPEELMKLIDRNAALILRLTTEMAWILKCKALLKEYKASEEFIKSIMDQSMN
jgi:hypothetical protein